jgi:hypothetical protein
VATNLRNEIDGPEAERNRLYAFFTPADTSESRTMLQNLSEEIRKAFVVSRLRIGGTILVEP